MTHKELAKELKISRQTVGKFFRGEPVDRQYFVQICEELQLEWDEIAAKPARKATVEAKKQDSGLDIDELVQKVRVFCRDKIQHQCGTMQLLDVSHPVELDNLYVDVNILEKIPSQRWLDISKRLQDFNPTADSFDRFYLGEVRQEQIPGLEAAAKNSKLMVLGKPGSGKTTFLKHLAIECSKGKFQANCVPIFIGLKRFTDNIRNTTNVGAQGLAPLQAYINQQLQICDVADADVESLLKHGRALILLDGLDEVSEQDSEAVQKQIIWFCERYFKNQFVITCRTQAQNYRFEGFAYVEVADFNQNQIEAFAKKWFVGVSRNSEQKGLVMADEFIQKLRQSENQRVKELGVTPILLSLICLVFNELNNLPANRAKLYEQGLNILLNRWDESRGIKRDKVYRNLSLLRKVKLLSQVAAITFKQGKYFFEQDKIQQLIAGYLCTLPDVYADPETLQLDSDAVLKSIETQHGLLVERAREIYSFSHLTFQEYFTAKDTVTSSDAKALKSLLTEKRWNEVFLLVAGMRWNIDTLLRLKQQIDELVASDKELQRFLAQISKKSSSIKVSHNPAVVRALCHAFCHAYKGYETISSWQLAHMDACCSSYSADFYISRARDTSGYFYEIALDTAGLLDSKLQQLLQQFSKSIWNRSWEEEFRSVGIEERNINIWDCKYSTADDSKAELLKQYYDANKLLVDCLNSSEVTLEVRSHIEATLLLPIAEIEKRNRNYTSELI